MQLVHDVFIKRPVPQIMDWIECQRLSLMCTSWAFLPGPDVPGGRAHGQGR